MCQTKARAKEGQQRGRRQKGKGEPKQKGGLAGWGGRATRKKGPEREGAQGDEETEAEEEEDQEREWRRGKGDGAGGKGGAANGRRGAANGGGTGKRESGTATGAQREGAREKASQKGKQAKTRKDWPEGSEVMRRRAG